MKSELLKHKPIFEKFLAQTPFSLSAFSFISIFAWKDFFDFEFKVVDDNLCIFAKDSMGCFLYLPPLGSKFSKATAQKCFELLYQRNKGKGVSRIENVEKDSLNIFPEDNFQRFKKGDEFVYLRKDIAELKGNQYKAKRASYNQFIKNYSFKFLPYESRMKKECLSLYDCWMKNREQRCENDVYRQMLKENRLVHKSTLDYCQDLGLIGRVVFVDNKLVAYSFGFPLKNDIFCVLFEVTNLDIKGLSVYLFREFCRDTALKDFSFINVMDDFGLENIRLTKLSFRPCQIVPSYTISKKDIKDGRFSE